MVLCSVCGRTTCHDGAVCAACRSLSTKHQGQPTTAVDVVVPYSFKLLMQEINALCIDWQAPPVMAER